MRYEVVTVRDAALNGYGRPFFVAAVGVAIRSFADELGRQAPDNAMAQHPEDYDLYHVGSFDDATGELTAVPPTRIAQGALLKG